MSLQNICISIFVALSLSHAIPAHCKDTTSECNYYTPVNQHLTLKFGGGISGFDSAKQATTPSASTARPIKCRPNTLLIILCLLITAGSLGFSAGCISRIRTLKMLIERLQKNAQTVKRSLNTSYHPYRSRNDDNERLFIERLDTLIAENIGRHDLNVDFLAGKMLVSRSLLFTRVKRISGKSVVEYVNDRRIAKAIELLHNDKYSLTEISELVGYSSLRYFSRVFKSVTGEQPSIFRQNLRNEKTAE